MRSLRASLLNEPPIRVMAIAEAWDVALEAASPAQMADALAAAMRETDIDGAPAARRVRAELPADAGTALGQLLASAGRMPAATFERRFGEIRPMGPGRLERERPWRTPANAAETLWYRGFVFRAFDRAARDPAEYFYIPTELRDALTEAAAAPPARAEAGPEAPGPDASAGSALLDDIVTLLMAIQAGDVRATREGEWTPPSRMAIFRWLCDPDGADDGRPGGRFALLAGLITALGWARLMDGRLRLTPQPVAEWLQVGASQQRAALIAAWRDSEAWNDLRHVDGLAFEMTHAWSNQPRRDRAAALSLLEAAAGAGWPALLHHLQAPAWDWAALQAGLTTATAAIAAVKRDAPDFMRPDGRYDTWHIRDARTGEFLNGFEAWDRVEGGYLLALLTGPLRWLEAGRHAASDPIPPDPALSAGPAGEITVAPGARFARFQLARIAQPLERRQDGGWVFRLTPASLAAAARQGISFPRAVAFLEKSLGGPLSPTLAKAAARAAERGSEARVEPGALLRARDPAILDAVLRLEAPRRALIERLSPTTALIRAGELREVAAAAAEQGLLIDLGP